MCESRPDRPASAVDVAGEDADQGQCHGDGQIRVVQLPMDSTEVERKPKATGCVKQITGCVPERSS